MRCASPPLKAAQHYRGRCDLSSPPQTGTGETERRAHPRADALIYCQARPPFCPRRSQVYFRDGRSRSPPQDDGHWVNRRTPEVSASRHLLDNDNSTILALFNHRCGRTVRHLFGQGAVSLLTSIAASATPSMTRSSRSPEAFNSRDGRTGRVSAHGPALLLHGGLLAALQKIAESRWSKTWRTRRVMELFALFAACVFPCRESAPGAPSGGTSGHRLRHRPLAARTASSATRSEKSGLCGDGKAIPRRTFRKSGLRAGPRARNQRREPAHRLINHVFDEYLNEGR